MVDLFTQVSVFGLVAAVFWLLGVFMGYERGVRSTERRWSEAVERSEWARKHQRSPEDIARQRGI